MARITVGDFNGRPSGPYLSDAARAWRMMTANERQQALDAFKAHSHGVGECHDGCRQMFDFFADLGVLRG